MNKRILSTLTAFAAGLPLVAVTLLPVSVSALSNTTKIVTMADLDNTSSSPAVVRADGLNKWFMYNDSNDTVDNTLGSFVVGPSTPPNNKGSIEFTLGSNPYDRKNIATYQFAGTPLSNINEMSFTAYSHSGVAGPNESPYLNFNVDFNGSNTWQKRLVYVPSANQASVPQDTWNTFNTVNGGNGLWTWSGFAGNGNKWPDGNTNMYRSWNDIKSAFNNARILSTDSWLGVRVGEPGPNGYTGNIDAFSININGNKTTFDFEKNYPVPKDKDECKKDGWKKFTDPSFKNQGQCIKYVEEHEHDNDHGHHDKNENRHNEDEDHEHSNNLSRFVHFWRND